MSSITKNDILEAIATEPLTSGIWIRGGDQCRVCAVGAVIRRQLPDVAVKAASWDKQAYDTFELACKTITQNRFSSAGCTAAPGNYLSALSIVWEYLVKYNEDATIEDLRANLIDWAEENIPEDYEVKMFKQGNEYAFQHRTAGV